MGFHPSLPVAHIPPFLRPVLPRPGRRGADRRGHPAEMRRDRRHQPTGVAPPPTVSTPPPEYLGTNCKLAFEAATTTPTLPSPLPSPPLYLPPRERRRSPSPRRSDYDVEMRRQAMEIYFAHARSPACHPPSFLSTPSSSPFVFAKQISRRQKTKQSFLCASVPMGAGSPVATGRDRVPTDDSVFFVC